MAALTQRLPVITVPELHPVAPVRFDVVNDGGLYDQPQLSATNTQRVVHQEQATGFTPVPVIAAPVSVGTLFVIPATAAHITLQMCVLQAVLVRRRVRATEGPAGGGD